MTSKFTELEIDCADPSGLARWRCWWSCLAITHWKVAGPSGSCMVTVWANVPGCVHGNRIRAVEFGAGGRLLDDALPAKRSIPDDLSPGEMLSDLGVLAWRCAGSAGSLPTASTTAGLRSNRLVKR